MPRIIIGEPKKSIIYSGPIWDQVASPSECQHAGIPNNSTLGAVREFTIRRKAVKGMETALHIMTGWEAREEKKRNAQPPVIKVVYEDIHNNLTRQAALDDWIESGLGVFIEPWKPQAEKTYVPLPPLKVKPPQEVAQAAEFILHWYSTEGKSGLAELERKSARAVARVAARAGRKLGAEDSSED
jgi:hypothetical protein